MKKDSGSWSIPKGEYEPDEDLLAAERREFNEETGFGVEGDFVSPADEPRSQQIRNSLRI